MGCAASLVVLTGDSYVNMLVALLHLLLRDGRGCFGFPSCLVMVLFCAPKRVAAMPWAPHIGPALWARGAPVPCDGRARSRNACRHCALYPIAHHSSSNRDICP